MVENLKVLADYENIVNRLKNREGADWTKPPEDYHDFLYETSNLFLRKDTDYDSRFLRALIDLDAKTIWTWEVEKKLDRLRSWIKRGELQVKGEGIRNSVDDIFIYTVQYTAYVQAVINDGLPGGLFLDEVRAARRHFFTLNAERLKPAEWVEFLEKKGLIEPKEVLLKCLLRVYMGEHLTAADWKEAIRVILS